MFLCKVGRSNVNMDGRGGGVAVILAPAQHAGLYVWDGTIRRVCLRRNIFHGIFDAKL